MLVDMEKNDIMLDFIEAGIVEIEIDSHSKKVWINIDGRCRVRIGKAKEVIYKEGKTSGKAG